MSVLITLKKKTKPLRTKGALLTFFTMPLDFHQITTCCRWLCRSTRSSSSCPLEYVGWGLWVWSCGLFFSHNKLKRGVLSPFDKIIARAVTYFFIFEKKVNQNQDNCELRKKLSKQEQKVKQDHVLMINQNNGTQLCAWTSECGYR